MAIGPATGAWLLRCCATKRSLLRGKIVCRDFEDYEFFESTGRKEKGNPRGERARRTAAVSPESSAPFFTVVAVA